MEDNQSGRDDQASNPKQLHDHDRTNRVDDHHHQPPPPPPPPPPQRIPFTRLRQLDSDYVLAVALLQEQERGFSSLETIESEAESGEDEAAFDREDYEFFESARRAGARFEDSELGFLEDDYSDDDDDDEEMDYDDDDELDVDELTYEELIALGEFIGVEERGLSAKEISSCLRPIVRRTTSSSSSVAVRENGVVDRCVVCQVEYEDGEDLVALRCEHSYHSDCITKWLQIKKCCPICGLEVSSPSSTTSKNIDDNVK